MAHAVYQTKAYIIRTITRKEANEILVCFSERFGLIYVSSQSTRKQSSKMRMHIHSHALVTIDIVQGRGMWRLVGIHPEVSPFSFLELDWYPIVARYGETVMRLCAGEEPHESIWHDIESLFTHINATDVVYDKKVYEIILVARLLHHLGYWDDLYAFIGGELSFDEPMRNEVAAHSKKIIKRINYGLSISQL